MLECERLRERLGEYAELQEGATSEEIQQAEQALGCSFPSDYVDFLGCTNGLYCPTIVSLGLYATSQIEERNVTYQVAENMPGWIMIGDDGGGRAIVIDCTAPGGPVYRVGMGVMQADEAHFLAPRLADWIEADFDLQDPPHIEHPDYVDVWLVSVPAGGPKALLDIKNQLATDISIGAMYRGLQRLPFRLLREVPYTAYAWRCVEYNRIDDCLRLSEVESPLLDVLQPDEV